MPLIATGTSSDFANAPEGTHNAVCVDVIDLGENDTAYGLKHQVRLVWEIDEHQDDGSRFRVFMKANLSVHESATLGGLLRQWRGKDFTPAQLAGFDVESVVGAPCLLSVIHRVDGTKTYANVASATPLPRGMERIHPSGDYVREIDRTEKSKDVRSAAYEEKPEYIPAQRPDRPAQQHSARPAARQDNYTFEPDDDLPF